MGSIPTAPTIHVITISMKFFEDTTSTYQEVGHQGYYIANGKNFQYRYSAYLEATKANSDVKWNFNNEVYKTVNWSKPLNRTLPDLYRERAQQLRDKYDYLILSYSGGSDSDTVLHAFIDNGIHIDEVWVDWPRHMMEKVNWNATSANKDHTNLASEWHFTTEPKLRELHAQHPEIKIHVSDCTSGGPEHEVDDANGLTDLRNTYFYGRRRQYMCDYQHKLFDQGLSSAVILGIDKPSITVINDNIYARFVDEPIRFRTDIAAYQHSVVEFFYWTPDSPYMVVNQIHEILQYLQRNFGEFQRLENFLRTNVNWNQRANNLDTVTNTVCYPNWKPAFQTDKTHGQFEHQQFHSLLVPFVNTERFAKFFHHRWYEDHNLLRPDLLVYINGVCCGTKSQINTYPVMSLDKFYQGVQRV